MGFRPHLHARAATPAAHPPIHRVNSRHLETRPEIHSAIVAYLS
jgi:hypothetical protein